MTIKLRFELSFDTITDSLCKFAKKRGMKALQYIKEWLIQTAATFLLYLLLWILVLRDKFDWSPLELFKNFMYCGMFILTSMAVESVMLNRRFPHRLTTFKLALNGVLTLGLNLMLALLHETFLANLLWEEPSEDEFLCSAYIFCIVASIVSQFHNIRYYTQMILNQQEDNMKLTKAMLKSQLDPHFVFNSLNILTGLIEEDSDRAKRLTVSISKIYRYIIGSIEKDLVSISEAMTFAKEYVSVMQTRFPSSIDFFDNCLECRGNEKILTMSMQLLIEIAIKHNSPSPEHPLQPRVFRRGDWLVVSNSMLDNNQDQVPGVSCKGVGLKNLIRRYSIECGKAPVIRITEEGGRRYFEVNLPIIQSL